LLVAVVVLLLMAPAACKADGISENCSAVTPALNATNIGSFFTVTGGAADVGWRTSLRLALHAS
jgi:hypothetical protein